MLQNVTSKSAFRLPSLFLRPAYFPISSRSQGGRGGGSCSLDPLIFLDFIPCSPLIKPLVPKNVFSSCSLYPENFCAVPLIPKNVYYCSPYLFASFTFLFIVKKSPYLQINLAQVQSSISPWVFPAHCGILLQ